MPYITKISAQKNNTERVNIFLDEKYAFSVDLDVLVQHDLKKGKELDEADIIEIQFGDAVKKGFQPGRRLFIVSDEISERSHRLFDEKRHTSTCY